MRSNRDDLPTQSIQRDRLLRHCQNGLQGSTRTGYGHVAQKRQVQSPAKRTPMTRESCRDLQLPFISLVPLAARAKRPWDPKTAGILVCLQRENSFPQCSSRTNVHEVLGGNESPPCQHPERPPQPGC